MYGYPANIKYANKKMEDSLGIIIFDRSKQPIVHTEIGKIIIDQARVILREKTKSRS